jgi:hypothetical protein
MFRSVLGFSLFLGIVSTAGAQSRNPEQMGRLNNEQRVVPTFGDFAELCPRRRARCPCTPA